MSSRSLKNRAKRPNDSRYLIDQGSLFPYLAQKLSLEIISEITPNVKLNSGRMVRAKMVNNRKGGIVRYVLPLLIILDNPKSLQLICRSASGRGKIIHKKGVKSSFDSSGLVKSQDTSQLSLSKGFPYSVSNLNFNRKKCLAWPRT
jgi:hypothetical protein